MGLEVGISAVTNATAKYIYDAEGRRVAKENSGTGAVTASYVLSLNGDQLDEINGSGAWQHSNIFAMGKLYATYGAEHATREPCPHKTPHHRFLTISEHSLALLKRASRSAQVV